MAPPKMSSPPAIRLLAFEGKLVDGTRKTFDRQWTQNATMTLSELVSLVKKKTGTSLDGAISVGLVFERENGDAFALEDDEDVGGMHLRLGMSTPKEVGTVRFTLRRDNVASSPLAESPGPKTAVASDDSAQVSRPNKKVAGSSKTRPKAAEPAATCSHPARRQPSGRSTSGLAAQRAGPSRAVDEDDDDADEADDMDVEVVIVRPAKRLRQDRSKTQKAPDDDSNVAKAPGDRRSTRTPRSRSLFAERLIKPATTSKSTQPPALTSSSSTRRPTRASAVTSGTPLSSTPAVRGQKRKAPAASGSGSGLAASDKMTFMLGPDGIPVRRGPGRIKKDAVLLTEAEAMRALPQADVNQTKKRINALGKTSSNLPLSRADLLARVILPTLKSHSRETDQPVLDRKTLVSLTLVCKAVLNVAGVWLFSNVEIKSLAAWERVFGHGTPPKLAQYLGRDHVRTVTLTLPPSDLEDCADQSLSLAPSQFTAPRLSTVKIVLAAPDHEFPDGMYDIGHHKIDLETFVRSLHVLISSQAVARPTLLAERKGDGRPWVEILCAADNQKDAEAERALVSEVMNAIWEEMALEDAMGKGKSRELDDGWRVEQHCLWGVTATVTEADAPDEEALEVMQEPVEAEKEEEEEQQQQQQAKAHPADDDEEVDQIDHSDEDDHHNNGLGNRHISSEL